MKNSGQSQLNQATTDFGALGNEGMQAWAQIMPMLHKFAPMLMSAMTGSGPMYEAARSPAIAQTQQDIASIQNSSGGGVANPNALYENVAAGGQQTASLGANNIITTAAQLYQGLINNGMNFSGQALSGAGQGEASVGQYENQANNQFWQSLLGAAGTAAGMMGGKGAGGLGGIGGTGGGYTPPGGGVGWGITPEQVGATMPMAGGAYTGMASGYTPSGSQTGISSPISSPNPGTPTAPY